MPIRAGDTFVGHPAQPLGTAISAHLWIVVHVYTPELDTTEFAVLVNVTSWLPSGDQSCVVVPGDHAFIAHQSYVYYQRAMEVAVTDLMPLLQQQKLYPHGPASASLLTRVRRGLHASKFTPKRLKGIVPVS